VKQSAPALISHPRRSKAMNDLVSRSRASQRGFPCSESRLCILQERARHSKSSPPPRLRGLYSLFNTISIWR